jgi:C4-dicarboxylate-specific signal transduction histidine kinase
VRDVTRRKALEEDLRRKRAEAEAAEAALRAAEAEARDNMEELARVSRALVVGEFAASVAHELNQPIAAIVTNGEASLRWLGADPPNLDEARLAIGRTIRDANRAAGVISRTRGMLAKGPSAFSEIDINASIEDVLLFTETELRRNRVELRKTLAPSAPRVLGDRIQLQQVALNLIRNSIEAMADNGERPRVLTVGTEMDDAGQVLVRVEDTGPGLEPDAVPRLFDSFFTTKLGGVGLGLPISRSIIEAHGGRLWASPREGGGVAFQFVLPVIGPG